MYTLGEIDRALFVSLVEIERGSRNRAPAPRRGGAPRTPHGDKDIREIIDRAEMISGRLYRPYTFVAMGPEFGRRPGAAQLARGGSGMIEKAEVA